MTELGYKLSSEEHRPQDLVRYAARAEEAGAAEMVSEDDVARTVACGPDPEAHLEVINKFAEAGYEQLVVHQIGPDQDAFFDFYAREILPTFS